MDCGEASEFVHKIHLVDERPFRLRYRRVPPGHYEKLRTALNDMEEASFVNPTVSTHHHWFSSGRKMGICASAQTSGGSMQGQ